MSRIVDAHKAAMRNAIIAERECNELLPRLFCNITLHYVCVV